jgi:radical SAM protein with 4Fe4S-binding SPASM domain
MVVKIKINKFNYRFLPSLAGNARKHRISRLKIEPDIKRGPPYFSESVPFIYPILDHEMDFEIWLHNFPYCVLNEKSRDHILGWSKRYRGEKSKKCSDCRYSGECSGFPPGYFEEYGSDEIQPINDLPMEVMIEVEPRCNFDCQFCFNKISFAREGRNIKKALSTGYVKKITDSVFKAGIKIIRFTGGEPLLRRDIFELMRYAKSRNLEVWLNTNASLITAQIARKLKEKVDNVLIPIESCGDKEESRITGYPGAFRNKIRAIKLLKKEKIPVVRVGTVASNKNISNFERMSKLVSILPVDAWEWYRPISDKKNANGINRQDTKVLVNKIIAAKRKSDVNIIIANALPFCAIDDLNKINSVSNGALFDDGHSRLVIDPRGFAKPHYFLDKNIGNPLNILKVWNHRFMKRMRNLDYLPKECVNCSFKFKCRGGSRYEAKVAFGSYQALDPLAQPKFLSKINQP